MTEAMAIPGWKTEPTTLDAWVARLEEASGAKAVVERESGGTWVILNPLRLRGYAVLADGHVEAINFEWNNAAETIPLLERVAASIGWEIHPDDDDDDDADDDND